tara:strand:+ start:1406 stop:2302 length:897 start_codon:yes stop_codon:yes gene_type:complete
MSINLLMLIVSFGTLGLVIYLFLKVREQNIKEINQSFLMEEKFKTFSDDIKEIGKELVSVTTPINELNRFLGGNVTTGRLGEWNLESIVRDIMPDGSYEFQHIINSQTSNQVDCAVTTAEGIIVPIDSKLYAGQYRQYQDADNDSDRSKVLRDLRTAVLRDAEDIADKYILQNATSNYAVLYVASEKIIDLIDRIDDLRQECLTDKKILIQGPNTLAAFLDTIRVGHHYLRLNETAEKVALVVRNIQTEFRKFDTSTEKVLKRLEAALKEVNELQTRVNVLGKTLDRGAESLDEDTNN